MTVIS